jgi:transcription factor CRZ1
MDDQQRGRSPSASNQNRIRHTPSPSPHGAFQQSISPSANVALDQSLSANINQFSHNSFGDQLAATSQPSFDPNDFLNATTTAQQDQFTSTSAHDNSFLQAQSLPQAGRHSPAPIQAGSNGFTNDFLDPTDNSNLSFGNDPQLFDGADFLDPQLLGGDQQQQQQDQSIDPSSLMNQMTTHQQNPTPPHMLQADMSRHSSASPHVSPSMPQAQFSSHSRHTSLDPSSAAFPQGMNPGWGEGQQFRGHRRSPSDAHSDVSSNFNSPYLASQDNFDPVDHHSPLLQPQTNDAVFAGGIALDNFNINDQPQQPHISPIPSPHHSPRVGPQQPAQFSNDASFGLAPTTLPNHFGMTQTDGSMFQAQDPFPTLNQVGQAQSGAMSPPDIPDINIMPAPPSRQASFEPPKGDGFEDTLSPPDRSKSH